FDDFFAVTGGFLFQLDVFDYVFGRLRDDPAAFVEALAPGAPGDLMKVARSEERRFFAVEFAQARKEHRANGHIDADAKGVRATDDLEQAFLGQLLDEHPVFRQKPCMVQTDSMLEPLPDVRTVRAAELESFQRISQKRLFLASRNIDAGK